MAAITSVPATLIRTQSGRVLLILKDLVIAALLWELARRGYIVAALVVVTLVELWPAYRRRTVKAVWDAVPLLVAGLSAVLIISLLPKLLAQTGVAVLYAAWRIWQSRSHTPATAGLARVLVVQAAAFEALFLMAAVWHVARPVMLVLIWVVTYAMTYQELAVRGERAAGLLAAAWALVVTEASWVFLVWLVSYVPGQYVIVPQPALVLTALGYCFGNIYVAQRQGQLNRARLTEYLLIGLILIWIVIAGTPWQGTL